MQGNQHNRICKINFIYKVPNTITVSTNISDMKSDATGCSIFTYTHTTTHSYVTHHTAYDDGDTANTATLNMHFTFTWTVIKDFIVYSSLKIFK